MGSVVQRRAQSTVRHLRGKTQRGRAYGVSLCTDAAHSSDPGAAAARAKRISSGQWDQPSFEMSMARKDLRLMVEEAARGGQTLAMVPAFA
jgi:hypothetical protein